MYTCIHIYKYTYTYIYICVCAIVMRGGLPHDQPELGETASDHGPKKRCWVFFYI